MLTEDEITYKIRGSIYEVFKQLGPGLLESVYEACLYYELSSMGLTVQCQVPLPVNYKSINLDIGFRLDLLVEDLVIVEIKSVEILSNVHKKQLLTYLRLTGKKIGILVNFNTAHLVDKESIIRIVNQY